ncbi:MAG: hypothetical protein ACI9OF_002103 [Saprospiraceae bacterium]|jgi:hypothetical protein
MRIIKTKDFSKWAGKEGLTDKALSDTMTEIENGLVDANLGGNVYKKRVAVGSKGKSGVIRTLLAYKFGDKAFFLYCFAKNVRANIKTDEEKALRLLAKTFMAYSAKELNKAVKAGALIETKVKGDE